MGIPLLLGHLGTLALKKVPFKIFLLGSQLPCQEKPISHKEVTCRWLTVSASLLSPSSAIIAKGLKCKKSHL